MADVKWSQFPSAIPGNSDEVVGLKSGGNVLFSIANIVAAVRNGLANIFVPKSDVGAANGVASLDNTGKVPTSQLPSSTGPEPATATPLMDGTGAVGISTKYAREDHEHPTDTNKQAKITASGILKGDGQGGVSAATAGTDYQAPLTAGTDYATPAQLADKANTGQIGYPESGTTASRNYSAGDYICWNGLTYTADTAIASGATFYTSDGNKNLTECAGGGFNSLKAKLVTNHTITYNSADSAFIADTPPIDSKDLVVVGRNTNTGAIYAMWYRAASHGFRISATLYGNAPANGDTCVVQYAS